MFTPTPRTCDYHDWPLVQGGYHLGPEDPEGIDGRARVPCPRMVPCKCTCWPDGCPFLAEDPWLRCEPCRTDHPHGLQGQVIVGHLYPDIQR
jgi:hypothetical protein